MLFVKKMMYQINYILISNVKRYKKGLYCDVFD